MIHEEFPNYEARIAVGLVGEGSECFGYNDAISRDHDFALGFCLWLSEEDYRSIGGMLQKSYEQLLVDLAMNSYVKMELKHRQTRSTRCCHIEEVFPLCASSMRICLA